MNEVRKTQPKRIVILTCKKTSFRSSCHVPNALRSINLFTFFFTNEVSNEQQGQCHL
jgi:hypothetical protein